MELVTGSTEALRNLDTVFTHFTERAIRIVLNRRIMRLEGEVEMTQRSMYRWVGILMPALIAFLAATIGAQESPRELFERARLLEENGRNLNRAVQVYEQVVAQSKTDRALRAAAHLRIALAKERQGKAEARAVFATVAREYPDQPQVVSTARERLAASIAARGGRSDIVPRRVLDGGWAYIMDVSADGRIAVGSERTGYSANRIVARDVQSGTETVAVADTPSGAPGVARISRDGRRIAYTWNEVDDSKRPGRSLRIIGTEPGSKPEVLMAQATARPRPSGWSPDSKRILVNVQRYPNTTSSDATSTELAWVSVEDKSFRILKTFEPWQNHYPERLSSDGRFIAYAAEPRPGSSDRYIYVLDAETQKETAVVTAAGFREAPVWSPDGTHLLFMEHSVLKCVSVRDGRAVGEPRVVHSGMEGTLVGFTATGTIYFIQSVGGGNYHYIVPRSPSSGDRLLTFSGLSSAWSPDGRSMAFVRGNSLSELELIVRDIESGEERSYRHEGIDVVSPRWMPDGSGVLVLVNEQMDAQPRASFQLVDLRTGKFRRLFDRDANGRSRTNVSTLSPDGRTLFVGVKASESSPVMGIVGVDLATGKEREVATFSSAAGESGQFGIAVSPDGATLAVAAWAKPYAAARLFTVGVDGSNYRQILGPFDTGWIADTTRWTPDGRMLIFVAFDARKNWRIMRVPIEGGQAQSDGLDFDTLTPLLGDIRMWPGNFNNIDLSPDGSRIVASSLTFSKHELWTLDGVLSFINSH